MSELLGLLKMAEGEKAKGKLLGDTMLQKSNGCVENVSKKKG